MGNKGGGISQDDDDKDKKLMNKFNKNGINEMEEEEEDEDHVYSEKEFKKFKDEIKEKKIRIIIKNKLNNVLATYQEDKAIKDINYIMNLINCIENEDLRKNCFGELKLNPSAKNLILDNKVIKL
jgi:hypothetical protein